MGKLCIYGIETEGMFIHTNLSAPKKFTKFG